MAKPQLILIMIVFDNIILPVIRYNHSSSFALKKIWNGSQMFQLDNANKEATQAEDKLATTLYILQVI